MNKFIEDSKFFFTDFHKGTVNIILLKIFNWY